MLKKEENLAEIVLQTFSQGTVVLYICEAFGDYAPLFITPNIQSQLGYTDEEFLTEPDFWASHIHPDDRERILNDLGNLFEEGLHTHEYRFQHKNGSYRWMHDQLTLIRDATRTPVEIVGYWLDITMRKETENALQDSEEKYRLAMEATREGLWDWDVTTGSVYYSPGWNSILGEVNEQNNYSTWDDRIHPEDKPRILKTLRSHLSGETAAWQEEHRLRNINGDWIWVLGRGQVVNRDRNGNPLRMVGTMSDINARIQAEKVLSESKKAAELANTLKSRFLAAASHDLRQPLQAISSNTDLLTINNSDPVLARPIQQLSDATLAMQELLEGLLDVSKLDSGVMRPEVSAFSVSSLLNQLQEQYQSIAMGKDITLRFVPCTAVVRSDPALLRVILQNLISNAIKYTSQGKVIIGCVHRGDKLRIEVRDSGAGIPEDEQEAIFEEFYQLDNPARDRSKGTGIGLTIVKRMAALLEHPLYIHSVVGKGSSFAIEVPVTDSDQEETAATVSPDYGATGGSILFIEDDEAVLNANCMLLETLGYKVIPASSAEAAMQRIATESHTPEIIISDYRLPGGCVGTELIQQLRTKADSLIPAIILTGDMTLSDDNDHLPDNSLLLQKPVRAEEMVQAINQLLGDPASSAE